MSGTASLLAGRLVIVVLVASVFVSVGCGGGGGGVETPSTETTAPVTETPTAVSTPTQSRVSSTPEPAARTTNTPEPSAATTAQPEATSAPEPTPVATPNPDDTSTTPRSPKPASAAGTEGGSGSPVEDEYTTKKPGATPPAGSKSTGGSGGQAASQGQEYTWHDGDRIQRVRLQNDLVVQPSADNADDDVVARDDGETSIVQTQPRHETSDTEPVFRSQSGDLMTLPGGVLLALDATWDQVRVNRFFSDNGIDKSRVEGRDFAVNAFFVETEPGFASLNLANELAEQEGVLISSPNWQTEVSLR